MYVTKNKEVRSHWLLKPEVAYLNHGSFGACPKIILDKQMEYRNMLEEEPVQFMVCALPELLWRTQRILGKFVCAAAEDIVLVQNATEGVNAVLQSIEFQLGDEILFFDQIYGACKNTIEYVAKRHGAICRSIPLPIPIVDPNDVINAMCNAWNENVKLVLLDHICSPSGWILPIEDIVTFFEDRGTMVLVDGAHALGQIPLDLQSLGASFYVANAHKWLCAPKGSAFLYVREDLQSKVKPTCISHGATWLQENYPKRYSRFQMEFSWTGTSDPTAHLCLPDCIDFMKKLHPDGIIGIQTENTNRARVYRKNLVDELGGTVLAPDDFVGHMGSFLLEKEKVIIPKGIQVPIGERLQPLWKYLYDEHKIEVVVFEMQEHFVIRYSVQAYVSDEDIERLCRALNS